MKHTYSAVIILAILLATVAGCSVINSQHVAVTEPKAEGFAYYLPSVYLRLTATLTNIVSTNFITYTNQTMTTNWSSTTVIFTNGDKGSVLISNITTATTLTNTGLAPQANLSTNQVYVTALDSLLLPDVRHYYALQLTHYWISSDNFALAVNTNGFLQSVNATNTDNTPNILQNIASAVVTAMGGLPASVPFEPTEINTNTPDWKNARLHPESVQVVFDPSSLTSVEQANSNLTHSFFNFSDANLDYAEARKRLPIIVSSIMVNAISNEMGVASTNVGDRDGVLYRPALPYFVGVENHESFAGNNIQWSLAAVPNHAPVFSLSVKESLFVTYMSAFTFNNGFLASASYSKPSEIAGLSGLPGAILNGIEGGITNVTQLRFNIDTSKNTLVAAQTTLLNSMTSNNSARTNYSQSVQLYNNYNSNQATNKP